MKKLEEVARAIGKEVHGRDDPLDMDYVLAKAAIEELMKVDEGMEQAGFEFYDGFGPPAEQRKDCVEVFQAMLKRVLEE